MTNRARPAAEAGRGMHARSAPSWPPRHRAAPAGGVLGGRARGGPRAASDGAPIVAFYGDSYTRGTGASSPERRWSTIVSEERGWYEFNPSVDGLGFVNNRGFGDDLVDLIVEHDPPPDIVIVTMGLNDNFSMPAAADEHRGRDRRRPAAPEGRTARCAAHRRRTLLVHRRATRLGRPDHRMGRGGRRPGRSRPHRRRIPLDRGASRVDGRRRHPPERRRLRRDRQAHGRRARSPRALRRGFTGRAPGRLAECALRCGS